MDKILQELEQLVKDIEAEPAVERAVEMCTRATEIIQKVLKSNAENRGRVLELVKKMDQFFEEEAKC